MIRFSADLVRRVETADRFPSREFVEACDKALATGGALMRLLPLLDKDRTSNSRPANISPAGVGLSSVLFGRLAERRGWPRWLLGFRSNPVSSIAPPLTG